MPFVREFGCGSSLHSGVLLILWTILAFSFGSLGAENVYICYNKKTKVSESAVSLYVINSFAGVVCSLLGLYGMYKGKLNLIKPFTYYIIAQLIIVVISLWIYFVFIYPLEPKSPKRATGYILSALLIATVSSLLYAYSALILYSYKQSLEESGIPPPIPEDLENLISPSVIVEDVPPARSIISDMNTTMRFGTTMGYPRSEVSKFSETERSQKVLQSQPFVPTYPIVEQNVEDESNFANSQK